MMLFLKKMSAIFIVCAVMLTNAFVVSAETITFTPSGSFSVEDGNAYLVATSDKYLFAATGESDATSITISIYDKITSEFLTSVQSYSSAYLKVYAMHVKGDYLYVAYVQKEGSGNPRVVKYNIKDIYEGKEVEIVKSKGQRISNYSYIDDNILCRLDYGYQNISFLNTESLTTRASIGISDDNLNLLKSYTSLYVDSERRILYTVAKKNVHIYDAQYALSGDSKQDLQVYEGYITPGTKNITKIAGKDGYLYAATSEGIYIYNMEDISSPKKIDTVINSLSAKDIKFNNGHMYVAAGSNIMIYNFENPEAPTLITTLETDSSVNSINLRPEKIYAAQTGKVSVFDVKGIEIEETVTPGTPDETITISYENTLEEKATKISSNDEYFAVLNSAKTGVSIYKNDSSEKIGEIYKEENGTRLTIDNIDIKGSELYVSYASVLRKYNLKDLESSNAALKEQSVVPLFSDLAKNRANIIQANDKYIFVAAMGISTVEVALANSKILIFDRNTLEYLTSIRRTADSYDLPVRNMTLSGNKLFVSWSNAKTSISYKNAIIGSSLHAPVYVYYVENIEKGGTVSGSRITSNSALGNLNHPYNRGGNSFLDETDNLLYLGLYTETEGQSYVAYDISNVSSTTKATKKFTLTGGSKDCVEFFVHDGCFYEILQNNGGLSKTGTTTQEYNKINKYDISNKTDIDLSQNLKATYQTVVYGNSIISDITFDSGLAYIAAKGNGGVDIVNINDLKTTGFFLSPGESAYNVAISDGMIFVAASTGIYIYSKDTRALLGKYELSFAPYDIDINEEENKIYVAALRENGYGVVLSYSDSGTVEYVNSLILEDTQSFGAAFGDTYLFAGVGTGADAINSLWVYNTSSKVKAAEITIDEGTMPHLVSSGSLFYMYEGKTLNIYKVPSSSTSLANCLKYTYTSQSDITDICPVGDIVYLATKNGVEILNVSAVDSQIVTLSKTIESESDITALNVKDGYVYGACASGELFIYDAENYNKVAFTDLEEDVLVTQIEFSGKTVFLKTDSGSVFKYEINGDIVVTYDIDATEPEDKEVYSMKYEQRFPYVNFEKREFSAHSLICATDDYVVTAGAGDIKVYDRDLHEIRTIGAKSVTSLYKKDNSIIYADNGSVYLNNLDSEEDSKVICQADSGIIYADENAIYTVNKTENTINIYSYDGTLLKTITGCPENITKIYAKDGLFYVAVSNTLYIYNLSNPDEAVTNYQFGNSTLTITAIEETGGYLYVSTNKATASKNGLYYWDISGIKSGESTTLTGTKRYKSSADDGKITDFVVRGDYIIADFIDTKEVQVINIQDKANPYRESRILKVNEDNYSFSDIDESNGKIYAISSTGGICVYKYTAVDIADITFVSDGIETYAPQGDKVKAKVSIYNESGKTIEGKLILAVYEGTDVKTLSNIDTIDVSALNGEGTEVYTDELSVTDGENITIKAMLFESMDSLVPMCESIKNFQGESATTIYVDADANSGGNGSISAPFNTIADAKAKVRSINRAMTGDITVEIAGGRYELSEPLMFDENDSGFNGNKVIYKAKDGETPIISGGRKIEGWTLCDSEKGIYSAPANGIRTRHLVVDGERAVRARSEGRLINAACDDGDLGIYCYNEELLDYKNIKDVELVFNNAFTSKRAMVDSVHKVDSNGKVLLVVNNPFWNNPTAFDKYVVPSYYENALELLDEENEFYLDMEEDMVYYKPKAGTNINESEIYAPVLEELFVFEGKSLYNRVKNIELSGLTLTETTWMMPTDNGGFNTTQAGYCSAPISSSANPVAKTVIIERADGITVSNCELKNLGGIAISIIGSSSDIKIDNNEIENVSAGGIHIGEIDDSDANPKDTRKCINDILVSNNYINNIGCEYYTFCGITIATSQNVEVSHNEITNTPYSAIHIGWGWNSLPKRNITGLKVEYNYIHDVINVLSDAGAIYHTGMTLAHYEDNPNYIRYNYIEKIRQGGSYAGAAIYLDTGSSGYAVCENVIDLRDCNSSWIPKWSSGREGNVFDKNYSTTSRGYSGATDTVVSINAEWDENAADIINNAGRK